MKKLAISFSLVLFTFLISVDTQISMGATYEFNKFDFPGSDHPWAELYGPSSINDAGHIVGTYCDNDDRHHGFMYDGKSFAIVDYPGATDTLLEGINNVGHIVGRFYIAGSPHAHSFLYDGNTYQTVAPPSASSTYANGINSAGVVVGSYWDGDGDHGFIYDGNSYQTIDYPGAYQTVAMGINDAGHIVGMYNGLIGFVYVNGTFMRFDFPGGWGTSSYGINDLGVIVGMNMQPAEYMTFVGKPGDFELLEEIPGIFTAYVRGRGINAMGQIVGTYQSIATYELRGFIATPVPRRGLVVDFGNLGLYTYDGTWTKLNKNSPEKMCAAGSDLYVDFGANIGLYKYDGAWKKLHKNSPEGMCAVGPILYADFGALGLYRYINGTETWERISKLDPASMSSYSGKLVVDFPSVGLYEYDGSWKRINRNSCEDMIAVDLY